IGAAGLSGGAIDRVAAGAGRRVAGIIGAGAVVVAVDVRRIRTGSVLTGLVAVAGVAVAAVPGGAELPVVAIANLPVLALRTVAVGALPGDAAHRALLRLELAVRTNLPGRAVVDAGAAVARTGIAASGAVVAAELALLVLEEAVDAALDGVAVDALHAIAAALVTAAAVGAAVRAVLHARRSAVADSHLGRARAFDADVLARKAAAVGRALPQLAVVAAELVRATGVAVARERIAQVGGVARATHVVEAGQAVVAALHLAVVAADLIRPAHAVIALASLPVEALATGIQRLVAQVV